MGSRTLLGVTGWLAAALLAVVVGLAAVRLIGEGLQGSAPPALSAAEVAEALASAPAPPAPSATPPVTPSATPAASATSAQTFDTPGGLVTARCAGGVVTIAGTSPAQGWGTHEVEDGGGEAEVDFRSGRQRIEVTVTCGADGRPVARTEDKSNDD